jgi:hypothetical protein
VVYAKENSTQRKIIFAVNAVNQPAISANLHVRAARKPIAKVAHGFALFVKIRYAKIAMTLVKNFVNSAN